MQIKDRVIQFVNNNDSFIIDEYGVESKKIYHRKIVISDDIYEKFEKNPDGNIHLDEFLRFNDINSKWEPYELVIPSTNQEETQATHFSRLFIDLKLEKTLSDGNELSEHSKSKIYKKVYDKLVKKETLIDDPLMLDVFNEALRSDTESAIWESVFPFFR